MTDLIEDNLRQIKDNISKQCSNQAAVKKMSALLLCQKTARSKDRCGHCRRAQGFGENRVQEAIGRWQHRRADYLISNCASLAPCKR